MRDFTGASKYSLYSSSGQLIFANDLRQDKWLDHVYLGGSLVAIRERNRTTGAYTTKYQHTDALGSPVAVTSQARTVLERREYEPYGRQLRPTAMVDGVGYTGHVGDAATGLVYMQQRYYDPGIGRFLSVDPVTANRSTGANFNRYWYANDNPYKFVDPDGRAPCTGTRIGTCVNGGTITGLSSRQLRAVKRYPQAYISRLNEIPNKQSSEADSARYFSGTARVVTAMTGREVGADIATLGGSRHTVVNYELGTNGGVDQLASYSGPGIRVAIAHTHPGNMSFSGRSAVYSNGWRGGFHKGDTERALAATMQNSIPVNAYVVGIGGGIHKFDMRSMWGDVNANRNGYFDADNYISEVE